MERRPGGGGPAPERGPVHLDWMSDVIWRPGVRRLRGAERRQLLRVVDCCPPAVAERPRSGGGPAVPSWGL